MKPLMRMHLVLSLLIAVNAQAAINGITAGGAGIVGNSHSMSVSFSGDGRLVAISSYASNLVAGDTNSRSDIFIFDRQTGKFDRISTNAQGVQGNDHSFEPVMSADGRFAVFYSRASNLVPGDTNGMIDVFLFDRQDRSIRRISVGNQGEQGNGHSLWAAISADGSYVVYESQASTLVPGDSNNAWDIFLYDRLNNTTQRVSTTAQGGQANGSSYRAVINGDGSVIAFYSSASNLVAGDRNDADDVFVLERNSGVVERVSVSAQGAEGNQHSIWPSMSRDGRFVSFHSLASNLVPGDSNGEYDGFVVDRKTGDVRRISVSSNGLQANGLTHRTQLSGDGRLVTFFSRADNLVNGDSNGQFDIFLHDRVTQETERLSINNQGVQGNHYSQWPVISDNGQAVGFISAASNLYVGDNNNFVDIFVVDVAPRNQPPVAVIDTQAVMECNGSPSRLTLSATGSSDPEDETDLKYEWSGPFGIANGVTVTVDIALGTWPVTLKVTDSQGASDSVSAQLQVVDTTAPMVDAGGDVTVEATHVQGAAYLPRVLANDTCGSVTSLSVQPTPAFYPLGVTTVQADAVDSSGNRASDSMQITVRDTTAPVLVAPAAVSTEATDLLTSVELGQAKAEDIFPLTVSNDAPAGFILGTTQVTWSAVDSNGNRSSATQSVTVTDTTAPVFASLEDLVFEAQGELTSLTLTVPKASDIFGPVQVSAELPPVYPLGETPVVWSALDANGNLAQATQFVRLIDTTAPTYTFELLRSEINSHHHKMVKVARLSSVSDSVDSQPQVVISVSSNQPDRVKHDDRRRHDHNKRHHARDWQVTQEQGIWTVWVRAERDGFQRDDRIYTLDISVTDRNGNRSGEQAEVRVVHDQRKVRDTHDREKHDSEHRHENKRNTDR